MVEETDERIIGASRSLKKLATGRDDLVGMIAYGLFKFEQSEWAQTAKPKREEVDRHHSTLQDARVESLRSNAQKKLSIFVESLEDQWRDEMYATIRDDVITDMAEDIESRISKRLEPLQAQVIDLQKAVAEASGFWRAIWTNLVAWVLTLAISALVIFLYISPGLKLTTQ